MVHRRMTTKEQFLATLEERIGVDVAPLNHAQDSKEDQHDVNQQYHGKGAVSISMISSLASIVLDT